MSIRACRWAFPVGAFLWIAAAASAQVEPNILALEVGQLSFSEAFGGESPPGSGLSFDGQLDGDPLFGVTLELRTFRRLGLRFGYLTGNLPTKAQANCSPAPCSFTGNGGDVVILEADWSVEDEGSFSLGFVEVPFFARPRPTVQLFAGPTFGWLEIGGVESPGLNGLIVRTSASTPSFGLHLGAAVTFGAQRQWLAGIVARVLRTETSVTIRQPTVALITERFDNEDSLTTVGLTIGRRFGVTTP